MKRAINFERLAQLAGKERDSQESGSSGLCILVERDLARLPDLHNASKDVSADVRSQVSDIGAAIDAAASLPETVGEPDMGISHNGDPNDDIDPDDRGNVDSFYAISTGRWAELVSGADGDPVSAEEARAVFHSIRQRLDDATGSAAEGGNSVPVLSSEGSIALGEPISAISTIGALHQAIQERYGEAGWKALVALWHTAAGIEQPTRPSIDISDRIPETGRTSSPLPASPESEAEALRSLPGAVRRFWLREPPVPPAWRSSLPPADADDGSWAG